MVIYIDILCVDADKEVQSAGTSTNSAPIPREQYRKFQTRLIMSCHNHILLGPENHERALDLYNYASVYKY